MFEGRIRRLATAFLCGLLLSAGPALAQEEMPKPKKNYSEMSLADLAEEAKSLSEKSDSCRVVVPLLQELLARRDLPSEATLWLASARVDCAVRRSAFAEALEFFPALEEASGQPGHTYGLYLAIQAEDAAETVARLEGVLLSGDPEKLQVLTPEYLAWALRMGHTNGLGDEIERISAAAIRAGGLDGLDPKSRKSLVANAVPVAVAEGDMAFARDLLVELETPDVYITYLGNREFEPIWPAVEERVGPNFRAITAADIAKAEAAYDADPAEPEKLNDYARALYTGGEFEKAVALVRSATERPDIDETMVEDEAWALNLAAYSLDALGREDEADAIFDRIGGERDDPEYWHVNFTINRGSRLVGQGRWEEGLAAAEEAAKFAEDHGSPYARSLTLRDRICALHNLDREVETATLLDELRREAEDSPALLAEGLMCLDRHDEAAELLIAALDEESSRRGVLNRLQDQQFEIFYTRTILPQPRDLLATQPDLQRAFNKHARRIPEQFYPAASLLRYRE